MPIYYYISELWPLLLIIFRVFNGFHRLTEWQKDLLIIVFENKSFAENYLIIAMERI